MCDHDHRPWIDCWQCGGEGMLFDCFDGFCEDAEAGCDDCMQYCDLCRGKGGWYEPEDADTQALMGRYSK